MLSERRKGKRKEAGNGPILEKIPRLTKKGRCKELTTRQAERFKCKQYERTRPYKENYISQKALLLLTKGRR